MKFLPTLRPLALLTVVLALDACSTAANRRELYNTSEANGVWHDYERRREAEEAVGLPPGSTSAISTSAATSGSLRSHAVPQPRSQPLPADITSLPSAAPAAPAPAPPAPVAPAPDASVPAVVTPVAPAPVPQ